MSKITSFFQKIFAIYALIVFVGFFLMLYPFMFVSVNFKWARSFTHWMFRIWGYLVFIFTGILAKSEWRFKPKKNQAYVYCANHTSYADIPTLYINIKQDLSFIGKSSLGKVPLFGYIYSRVHILVNRRSVDSRREVIEKTKEAIRSGVSPIFFPEGTIPKIGKRPEMIDFKDGAFITAIDLQVPIVPVAILNNYLILPDDDMLNVKIRPSRAIFLEPIETKGLTLENVNELKKKTFDVISKELKFKELNNR